MNLRTREFLADGSFVKVVWDESGTGDDHVYAAHFAVHRANKGIVLSLSGCYDIHDGSPRDLTVEDRTRITSWAVSFVDQENEFRSW